MKKILFICSLFVASAHAAVTTDSYRGELEKCALGTDLVVMNTTNEMTESLVGASGCYVGVGIRVIREYYADTATDTGKKFIAFANAVHAASLNIYNGPDECYPECGTIAQTMRADTTESYIRQYVLDMLDYVDTLNI